MTEAEQLPEISLPVSERDHPFQGVVHRSGTGELSTDTVLQHVAVDGAYLLQGYRVHDMLVFTVPSTRCPPEARVVSQLAHTRPDDTGYVRTLQFVLAAMANNNHGSRELESDGRAATHFLHQGVAVPKLMCVLEALLSTTEVDPAAALGAVGGYRRARGETAEATLERVRRILLLDASNRVGFRIIWFVLDPMFSVMGAMRDCWRRNAQCMPSSTTLADRSAREYSRAARLRAKYDGDADGDSDEEDTGGPPRPPRRLPQQRQQNGGRNQRPLTKRQLVEKSLVTDPDRLDLSINSLATFGRYVVDQLRGSRVCAVNTQLQNEKLQIGANNTPGNTVHHMGWDGVTTAGEQVTRQGWGDIAASRLTMHREGLEVCTKQSLASNYRCRIVEHEGMQRVGEYYLFPVPCAAWRVDPDLLRWSTFCRMILPWSVSRFDVYVKTLELRLAAGAQRRQERVMRRERRAKQRGPGLRTPQLCAAMRTWTAELNAGTMRRAVYDSMVVDTLRAERDRTRAYLTAQAAGDATVDVDAIVDRMYTADGGANDASSSDGSDSDSEADDSGDELRAGGYAGVQIAAEELTSEAQLERSGVAADYHRRRAGVSTLTVKTATRLLQERMSTRRRLCELYSSRLPKEARVLRWMLEREALACVIDLMRVENDIGDVARGMLKWFERRRVTRPAVARLMPSVDAERISRTASWKAKALMILDVDFLVVTSQHHVMQMREASLAAFDDIETDREQFGCVDKPNQCTVGGPGSGKSKALEIVFQISVPGTVVYEDSTSNQANQTGVAQNDLTEVTDDGALWMTARQDEMSGAVAQYAATKRIEMTRGKSSRKILRINQETQERESVRIETERGNVHLANSNLPMRDAAMRERVHQNLLPRQQRAGKSASSIAGVSISAVSMAARSEAVDYFQVSQFLYMLVSRLILGAALPYPNIKIPRMWIMRMRAALIKKHPDLAHRVRDTNHVLRGCITATIGEALDHAFNSEDSPHLLWNADRTLCIGARPHTLSQLLTDLMCIKGALTLSEDATFYLMGRWLHSMFDTHPHSVAVWIACTYGSWSESAETRATATFTDSLPPRRYIGEDGVAHADYNYVCVRRRLTDLARDTASNLHDYKSIASIHATDVRAALDTLAGTTIYLPRSENANTVAADAEEAEADEAAYRAAVENAALEGAAPPQRRVRRPKEPEGLQAVVYDKDERERHIVSVNILRFFLRTDPARVIETALEALEHDGTRIDPRNADVVRVETRRARKADGSDPVGDGSDTVVVRVEEQLTHTVYRDSDDRWHKIYADDVALTVKAKHMGWSRHSDYRVGAAVKDLALMQRRYARRFTSTPDRSAFSFGYRLVPLGIASPGAPNTLTMHRLKRRHGHKLSFVNPVHVTDAERHVAHGGGLGSSANGVDRERCLTSINVSGDIERYVYAERAREQHIDNWERHLPERRDARVRRARAHILMAHGRVDTPYPENVIKEIKEIAAREKRAADLQYARAAPQVAVVAATAATVASDATTAATSASDFSDVDPTGQLFTDRARLPFGSPASGLRTRPMLTLPSRHTLRTPHAPSSSGEESSGIDTESCVMRAMRGSQSSEFETVAAAANAALAGTGAMGRRRKRASAGSSDSAASKRSRHGDRTRRTRDSALSSTGGRSSDSGWDTVAAAAAAAAAAAPASAQPDAYGTDISHDNALALRARIDRFMTVS